MKALILAAGLGTRLRPLTNEKPKCMVEVNGIPIIYKQIENIVKAGININDIYIVTGYKSEILKQNVNYKFNGVNYIDNIDYINNNNMYSVYLAKNKLYGDAFLMMNADVFYDSCILAGLVNSKTENAIVVDVGNYLDESMKVVKKDGKLYEISKKIKQCDALGNSIDVYKFSIEAGKKLFDKCTEYIEIKKEIKLWSEVAINDILKEINFCEYCLNGRWFEIDNFDDLKKAEELFK